MNATELADLCTTLRKHGVTSFVDGALSIQFGALPAEEKAVESQASEEPQEEFPDESTCPCGHPYFQHRDNDGCLEGCPETACEVGGE